jgi:hypothetical protein
LAAGESDPQPGNNNTVASMNPVVTKRADLDRTCLNIANGSWKSRSKLIEPGKL